MNNVLQIHILDMVRAIFFTIDQISFFVFWFIFDIDRN